MSACGANCRIFKWGDDFDQVWKSSTDPRAMGPKTWMDQAAGDARCGARLTAFFISVA
jgi:hypothetical protein